MTWEFHVDASAEQRLFSRILQTLESQMLTIHMFHAETDGAGITVIFQVSSEEDKAYRIEALLYRMHGVRRVACSLLNCDGAISEARAIAAR